MTLLVPIAAATGALLVYLGLTSTDPPRRRVGVFLERLAHSAGRPDWGARQTGLLCASSALAAAVVAGALSSSVVVLGLALSGGAYAPVGWLRGRARKRRIAHREVWPEAIALLTSGVRAGSSLPEVVAGLADRGPETLRPFFHRFRATHRSSASFAVALDGLARDLADPIADRVVAALKLANEVGGTDLVRVLRTLGDFVRDDLRVRKEIEARWSWTVTAARLAAAAPWLVLVAMSTRPEAAAAYDSPNGTALILCGGAATLVGYRLMLRAARLPEESRWSE